jgi:hypothetical protein
MNRSSLPISLFMRRWSWRLLLLVWAALTAYLAFAKLGTWPRLQVSVLLAQRKCLNFNEPPGKVILEMDPDRAAALLTVKDYRLPRFRYSDALNQNAAVSTRASGVFGELSAARERIGQWERRGHPAQINLPVFLSGRFLEGASDSFVLALQNLRCGTGGERLVVLRGDRYRAVVSIIPTVLSTTAGLDSVKELYSASDDAGKLHLYVKGLRLFAAQPDPLDPSRFTLDYENPAGRGTIEVKLMPDDKVKLRVLSGPASQRSGD